jgi:hypothetical protein
MARLLRHSSLRSLNPLRSRLLALCAHLGVLSALGPFSRGEALLVLHPRLSERLALHAGGGLSATATLDLGALATAAALSLDLRGAIVSTTATAMRPRIRRGRDRQRGYASYEKNPGHK